MAKTNKMNTIFESEHYYVVCEQKKYLVHRKEDNKLTFLFEYRRDEERARSESIKYAKKLEGWRGLWERKC